MSAVQGSTAPDWRGRWIRIALVASLGLNLLLVGAGVARYLASDGAGRFSMGSQMQLVPRKFLSGLDGHRRGEVLAIIRGEQKSFRELRRAARAQIITLADALEADPYEAARVTAAVEGFAATGGTLAQSGGQVALRVIAALSAEERKDLAAQLRMREGQGRQTSKTGSQPEEP